jgi:flagellar motility protein MotE (MotC chaperone)
MEMATAGTSIMAETGGEDTLEPVERNENGKRRRSSKVPATERALGDCRSPMGRAAREQTRELAHMLEKQTALQETQWRRMKTWLEQTEEKWDAYHQDDVLWGKGITDMVKRVVAATERAQR